MIYRLYTERKSNIASLVSKYFDGFTLIDSIGYWHDKAELSVIIEIITLDNITDKLNNLTRDIKVTNNQESVLITKQAIEFTF